MSTQYTNKQLADYFRSKLSFYRENRALKAQNISFDENTVRAITSAIDEGIILNTLLANLGLKLQECSTCKASGIYYADKQYVCTGCGGSEVEIVLKD